MASTAQKRPPEEPRAPVAASVPFVRFLGVGIVNASVSFGTFHGLLALLHHARGAPAVAQTVATALAMTCSYLLNRGWTFRSRAERGPEFTRFVVSQVALLGLSATLLEVAIDGFRWSPVLSWFGVAPGLTVLNYLGLRHWVFPSPRSPRPDAPPAA